MIDVTKINHWNESTLSNAEVQDTNVLFAEIFKNKLTLKCEIYKL